MRRIYLDNAATSHPKPAEVIRAMVDFSERLGASPGRGAYAEARQAGQLMQLCRERINTLIGGQGPCQVLFTLNATDALNIALHGLARPGDHIITTWLDHNSVLRPFSELARRGVEQTRVRCDPSTGLVDPADIRRAIRNNTRLVAMLHGSNVTGTLQPLEEVSRVAQQRGVLFVVDAAQTLGHVPLDVQKLAIDVLAFPGHKGLLGPLGTGGLYLRPGLDRQVHPLRQGGTGSVSDQDVQPEFLPDRYEAGSHNAIGILGLGAGVGWILERSVDQLWRHEQELTRLMLQKLAAMDGSVTLYGPKDPLIRCGVFSVRVQGYEHPQDLSDVLESRYGLLTRSGIHCAPLAHETIGTRTLGGTTRLSLGAFSSREDIEVAAEALAEIAREAGHRQRASAAADRSALG